jgi:hypothetical protein
MQGMMGEMMASTWIWTLAGVLLVVLLVVLIVKVAGK